MLVSVSFRDRRAGRAKANGASSNRQAVQASTARFSLPIRCIQLLQCGARFPEGAAKPQ